MNFLITIVLSLSLSGSILIAIIYLCKPLYKERLSKRWQYYVWLIVIARLLLPFSLEFNLVGSLLNDVMPVSSTHFVGDEASENFTIGSSHVTSHATNADGELSIPNFYFPREGVIGHSQIGAFELEITESYPQTNIFNTILASFWMIWMVVAIALFVRKITIYQSFVRFIKAGRKPVEDWDSLEQFGKILEQAGIRGTIGFYTNTLVSSPLLIGFFRPYIVLPSLNISESDFKYTILHELTHYRRGDMFYKWLVQFVICVHWFNPLVYVMGNEINKACEFSCDESVIKSLDQNAIKSYGDTLLGAIGIAGTYKNSLSAVSLSENKKILKERLDMIKYFKRKSRLAIIAAIIAAFVLSMGAMITGAYAMPSQNLGGNPGNTHEIIGEAHDDSYSDTVINIHSNNRNNVVESGSFMADDNQMLILQITSSIRGGTVDLFLFAPDGTEHRFTIGTTSLTEREVILTYGAWAYNAFGQFRSGDISIVGTIKIDSSIASPTPSPRPESPTPTPSPRPVSPTPTPNPVSPPPTPPPSLPSPAPIHSPHPTQTPNFNWPDQNWNSSGLQGIGEIVPLTIQTGNFTGMDINLPANITWRRAQDTSVTVVMYENFFEYLELYVKDGNLVIRSQTQLATTTVNRPRIYIYAPYINSVSFAGAVDTVNWDTIYSEHFTIRASGAVDVILDLQVNVLDVFGSGAVDFILSGNANTANISAAGAVDFLSFDLQIEDAVLIVSGAADIDISVSNTLSLDVSGVADVRYKGNPAIIRNNVTRDARIIHMQ